MEQSATTTTSEQEALAERILRYLRELPSADPWAHAPQIAMALGVTQSAVERVIDGLAGRVEVTVRGRWQLRHVAAVH